MPEPAAFARLLLASRLDGGPARATGLRVVPGVFVRRRSTSATIPATVSDHGSLRNGRDGEESLPGKGIRDDGGGRGYGRSGP